MPRSGDYGRENAEDGWHDAASIIAERSIAPVVILHRVSQRSWWNGPGMRCDGLSGEAVWPQGLMPAVEVAVSRFRELVAWSPRWRA